MSAQTCVSATWRSEMPSKWQKLGKQKICEDLLGGPMRHFPCSSYLSINCFVVHEFNLDMLPVLAASPRKGPGYPSLPESCQNHEVLHHSIQLKPAACKKLLKRSEKIWKGLVTKATNHEKPFIFRGFSTFASTWTISAARSESLKIYLHGAIHSFQKMWWTKPHFIASERHFSKRCHGLPFFLQARGTIEEEKVDTSLW